MKQAAGAIAILALGFVLGLWFRGRDSGPSAEAHAAALSALDAARDSLQRLPAVEVRWDTVIRESEPVYRVVRERQVDTFYLPGGGEPQFETIVVTDTVWLSNEPQFSWTFHDQTAAYTLDGECVANIANPLLSHTDYSLDIHLERLCRTRRFWVGGGLYDGSLFASMLGRFGRVQVAPMIGIAKSDHGSLGFAMGAGLYYGL